MLCNHVVHDAYQHNSIGCGNIFCKDCVDYHNKNDATNPCPSCGEPFTAENIVKDTRMDKEVDNFLVKCLNIDEGCKWRGEERNFKSHLDACEYQKVACTNKCGKTIQRHYYDRHLTRECPKRSYECSSCHEVGEHQHITGPGHLDTCPNLLISCSMCPKRTRRCNMEAHEAKCRVEPVPCQYQSVGCTAQPRRQDIPQHNLEAMSDHLQLAVQAIAQQSSEIAQLRRIVSMGLPTSVILKMENMSKIRKAKTTKGRTWYSSKFFTNSMMGYTACLRVEFNGTDDDSKFVSCYICVTTGKYIEYLESPFRGTFSVSILNHSESGQDYIRQLSSENGSSNGETIFGDKSFIQISELLALGRRSLYLKEDSLLFEVTVGSIQSRISPEMWCITYSGGSESELIPGKKHKGGSGGSPPRKFLKLEL